MDLDDEQRQYAETIHDSAESLLVILNDILDFSKIEAGRLDLEMIDFDLRAMLAGLCPAIPGACPSRRRSTLVTPLGRPYRRLCAVILSACARSSRTWLATPSSSRTQGEVSLQVTHVVAGGEAPACCASTVTDTGIGIAADKQELLFRKFMQADSSTTRQYGGTGLGLAISKQLVELMGGEIGVVSRLGIGSEFWFTVRLGRVHRLGRRSRQWRIGLRKRRNEPGSRYRCNAPAAGDGYARRRCTHPAGRR